MEFMLNYHKVLSYIVGGFLMIYIFKFDILFLFPFGKKAGNQVTQEKCVCRQCLQQSAHMQLEMHVAGFVLSSSCVCKRLVMQGSIFCFCFKQVSRTGAQPADHTHTHTHCILLSVFSGCQRQPSEQSVRTDQESGAACAYQQEQSRCLHFHIKPQLSMLLGFQKTNEKGSATILPQSHKMALLKC